MLNAITERAAIADSRLRQVIQEVQSPDPGWLATARLHLDSLTKPLGSLGMLEDIAAQVVSIQQNTVPRAGHKAIYIFAADHGVTEAGVSAYPKEVTRQMVLNFSSGGAAINVIARQAGAELVVVDVGVDADLSSVASVLHKKVRRGTRNMSHEPAMTEEEMLEAIELGIELAEDAKRQEIEMLAVGEMGIGNSTAASAMTAALTGKAPSLVTGNGTGVLGPVLEHKRAVIEATLTMHGFNTGIPSSDPLRVLRCVGGFEIAAMAGMILNCARHRILMVIDGFIATSAAAVACALQPKLRSCLFAGHQSHEPGHRVLLEHLSLQPILQLNMRLGEGTGAALAFHIMETTVILYNQMATFTSAQVSTAKA